MTTSGVSPLYTSADSPPPSSPSSARVAPELLQSRSNVAVQFLPLADVEWLKTVIELLRSHLILYSKDAPAVFSAC